MKNKQHFNKNDLIKILENILICLQKESNYYLVEKEVEPFVEDLSNYIFSFESKIQKDIFLEIETISSTLGVDLKLYFLTILNKIDPKPRYFDKILQIAIEEDEICIESKFFILFQCISITATNQDVFSKKTRKLFFDLYLKVYTNYKSRTIQQNSMISKDNRNKKLIFIFIGQYLSLNHGPTKSATDRAYYLKKLGYEVIIINTTEVLSQVGLLPYFGLSARNEISEYSSLNSISYLDEEIPYFQSLNMPNIEGVNTIINIVKEYKPYLILSLGSCILTADLCSNIIPVATISTNFSSLPITSSQFHITGREISNEDIKFVNNYGFDKRNLLQHLFTVSFKPQKNSFTKKDFNLPLDKKILIIVGARLDKELDLDFIDLLLSSLSLNTHILFAGYFDKYNEFSKNNEILKNNSTYIGFQDDILAVLELCDLYINPFRIGGGISAVEALEKEVPVVTFKKGDVYLNVGDDFAVEDENEMFETIKRYIEDPTYLQKMKKIGKEKSNSLTKTKVEMENLLNILEKNELFF